MSGLTKSLAPKVSSKYRSVCCFGVVTGVFGDFGVVAGVCRPGDLVAVVGKIVFPLTMPNLGADGLANAGSMEAVMDAR